MKFLVDHQSPFGGEAFEWSITVDRELVIVGWDLDLNFQNVISIVMFRLDTSIVLHHVKPMPLVTQISFPWKNHPFAPIFKVRL